MSGPRGEARSPVFIALAIQLGVFVCIAIFTLAAAKFTALSLPVYGLAIAQGVIAAIVTAAFGFSRPWIIGQLVAPPLLFLGNRLNVPDWVFPRSEERRVGKGGRAGGAASRARQESVRDET